MISKISLVIKEEEEKRKDLLSELDPDIAGDKWLFEDLPLLNGLYLMLLLSISHAVEKQLILLGARHDAAQGEISRKEQEGEVLKLKNRFRLVKERLGLEGPDFEKLERLRLLGNSFKHNPFDEPSEDRLKKLDLEPGKNYATLAESEAVRKALCRHLGMPEDSGYYEVTEHFRKLASRFLKEVEMKASLRPLKKGTVSLNPNDFAQ